MMERPLRVYLVDDEPLALKRLARLLKETNRAQIVGQTCAPMSALREVPALDLDGIFLDIQMPDLNGFQLLARLNHYPPVIFTTAFDEYALQAFEVFALDYLLKPIEIERLDAALTKLERMRQRPMERQNLSQVIQKVVAQFESDKPHHLDRLPSRISGKIQILDVATITQFVTDDKSTYACNAEGRLFPMDFSLKELEQRLDPRIFLRIHRSAIVNVSFISEVHGWFSGKVLVRLKDKAGTELVVARDRVKILKQFLGM